MSDRRTGRVRQREYGEQVVGRALGDSFFPLGCMEIWDERKL